MTCGHVARFEWLEIGIDLRAWLESVGAAIPVRAAHQVKCAADIGRCLLSGRARRPVQRRRSREQRLRVGVLRGLEWDATRKDLDDSTPKHHRNALRDVW